MLVSSSTIDFHIWVGDKNVPVVIIFWAISERVGTRFLQLVGSWLFACWELRNSLQVYMKCNDCDSSFPSRDKGLTTDSAGRLQVEIVDSSRHELQLQCAVCAPKSETSFDMGRGAEVAEVGWDVGVWGTVCNLDKNWQQCSPYIWDWNNHAIGQLSLKKSFQLHWHDLDWFGTQADEHSWVNLLLITFIDSHSGRIGKDQLCIAQTSAGKSPTKMHAPCPTKPPCKWDTQLHH